LPPQATLTSCGDPEKPIWVGTYWSAADEESEVPKPNDLEGVEEGEIQSPVTRKIIKTLKGHSIQFEDKDCEEMITIVQVNDESKRNVITMNTDGVTVLQQIDDSTSNRIEMTATGIKLTDFTDNVIELSDSAFTITSKVAFTIDASGQAVEVKAASIDFTKAS
jgi:hypothetical protein